MEKLTGKLLDVEKRKTTKGKDMWVVNIDDEKKLHTFGIFSESIGKKFNEIQNQENPPEVSVGWEQKGDYKNIVECYNPEVEHENKFVRFEELIQKAQKKFDQVSIVSEGLTPILDKETDMIIGWYVKGIVQVKKGEGTETYTAYGYATDKNVNDTMKNQLLHMADTRAKARALRVALAEKVSEEEMR